MALLRVLERSMARPSPHQARPILGGVAVCFVLACGTDPVANPFDSAGPGGSTGGAPSGTSGSPDEGSTGGDSPGSSSDASGGNTPKLDVGAGTGGPSMGAGCQKVDFLFIIDNSGSMKEEQEQLIASFPGFVAAIEDSVAVDDFHVLVVDADDSFIIDQCQGICPSNPDDTCGACAGDDECVYVPCAQWPPEESCDNRIGGGRITSPIGDDCGVLGGQRFLTSDQPDLGDAFSCIASVGTGASGERPMDAMMTAVGPMQAPGECNEGFVRDDALLVVTVISDEEDSADDDGIASLGDPAAWKQALVDAKHGDGSAVVFLGLVGDTDMPNAICQGGDMPEASPAPRLRTLAESFEHGQWESVCVGDYAPFFAESISVIDTACDEFVPAG